MKKHFLFLLSLFLISGFTAQAQFKFGVKAGVNLSKISCSGNKVAKDWYDNNVENMTGFLVGPMVEFTVPLIGVGMDAAVLYSQEGFKLKEINKSFKTNNLEVPVNLKYKITFLDVVGAFATAGPYIKFKLSDDLLEQYKSKSFGAGLNFGIGIELLSHLQVGVAYKLGLTNDYGSIQDVGDVLSAIKGKTSLWTVSAAYLF
ncbi:MAG: porin family protein [Candidatus Azobacteroides sp.]|nr:porin family protein [Candidatus Azobacteroides sp.]